MSSELSFIRQNLKVTINFYAVNKKGISCRKQGLILTDENSVSFQMFLNLMSSITLCSESQIPVLKEGRRNTYKSVFVLFVCAGKGGEG